MKGARLVREWDPSTGNKRTWYEKVDYAENIRSVAPKPVTHEKNHHIFDMDGNYKGMRWFLDIKTLRVDIVDKMSYILAGEAKRDDMSQWAFNIFDDDSLRL